eukprot:CAMPEP_0178422848 /NCGR_PEP_ID=MMETSP0689_2-20121128/27387_1 /TAXON_ID=160604 /ORGANISM="Amphidinium massartii, Strain CS-259" /LENGTH=124 /DNA_ID=CAMNT_0020044429 /DNA_START=152 /DNA_END=527 /DNA_ORIENTATION=-
MMPKLMSILVLVAPNRPIKSSKVGGATVSAPVVDNVDRSAGPGSCVNSMPCDVKMYFLGKDLVVAACLERVPEDNRLSAGEGGLEGLNGKTFLSKTSGKASGLTLCMVLHSAACHGYAYAYDPV